MTRQPEQRGQDHTTTDGLPEANLADPTRGVIEHEHDEPTPQELAAQDHEHDQENVEPLTGDPRDRRPPQPFSGASR